MAAIGADPLFASETRHAEMSLRLVSFEKNGFAAFEDIIMQSRTAHRDNDQVRNS